MSGEDQAWLDYRAKVASTYDKWNYSSPLQSAVMRAGHRLAEKPFQQRDHFSAVLELGAGTGEHLAFVRHGFDRYVLTDLDAKILEVAKSKLRDRLDKLEFETLLGEDLCYADSSFDRVIATHVLEHIYRPHLALKEWERILKSGGVLSVLIPTDPGLAWRVGRHLASRRQVIAQGIDYDYVMAREHVNSCHNLIAFLRHYFPHRTETWWPFPIPSIDVNVFFVCHAVISKPGPSSTNAQDLAQDDLG